MLASEISLAYRNFHIAKNSLGLRNFSYDCEIFAIPGKFSLYPSDRVWVSRQRHDFYSCFSSFLFLLAFSFLFHLEDYIGLHTWVTQTYYGSSTGLRPALQSEKMYIVSQPIGTIWCVVCELAKGGMFKVE